MKHVSAGQWILAVNALLFAGVGLAFLLYPAQLIVDTGLNPQSATALTELRAFYGAFEIAMATFMAFCAWHRPWISAGLTFLALAAAGLVLGRSLGLLIDGLPQPLTIKLMLVETLITLAALYGLRREILNQR